MLPAPCFSRLSLQRLRQQPVRRLAEPGRWQPSILQAVPFAEQGEQAMLRRAPRALSRARSGRLHVNERQQGAPLPFGNDGRLHGLPAPIQMFEPVARFERFMRGAQAVQRCGVEVMPGVVREAREAGLVHGGRLRIAEHAHHFPRGQHGIHDGADLAQGVLAPGAHVGGKFPLNCEPPRGFRLRRGRERLAALVDLFLHKRQGVGDPAFRQIVNARKLEVRLDLRPQRRVRHAGHLRPRMDERPQGLAAGGRGEPVGQPVRISDRFGFDLISASFANGWHNLGSNPVGEGVGLRLVGTEGQLVHGRFKNTSDCLLPPAKGGKFSHTLPTIRNDRKSFPAPVNAEGGTNILGDKPKRFTFKLCADEMILELEGSRGHFGKKFGLGHDVNSDVFRLALAEIAKVGSSKALGNAQAYSP